MQNQVKDRPITRQEGILKQFIRHGRYVDQRLGLKKLSNSCQVPKADRRVQIDFGPVLKQGSCYPKPGVARPEHGSETLAVSFFQIGSMIEEFFGNMRVGSLVGRVVQGGPLLVAPGIHIGPLFEEETNDLALMATNCLVQRSIV